MKLIATFFIMYSTVFFQSCIAPTPKKEDFIGKWKTDDGAIILLTNDVFKAENLSAEKMSSNFTRKKFNAEGTWFLTKEDGRWEVQLVFKPSENFSSFFFAHLLVAGENGLASNQPPWYLYKYVGDPDEGIMYEFHRTTK